MTYSKYKDVMCVGAGGGLVYYAALFFHLLGSKVVGFDQSKNQRTEDLKKRGIKIVLSNPQTDAGYNVDLIIYSSSIPGDFLRNLKDSNRKALFIEAGEFTLKLLEDFDRKKLVSKERSAFLASNIAPLYKLDLQGISVVGVTGTDGKTTTCMMLYHLLTKAGFRPAVVTTVSAKCGDVEVDTGFHTTSPSAQELHILIEKFKSLGCTHIILEVTSHALAMGRVAGLKINAAVFTNITQDHFDYHKNWENYITAKSLLITKNLIDNGKVVLNNNDGMSYRYLSKLISGGQSIVELTAQDIVNKNDHIKFNVSGTPVILNVLGEYNVSNALGALGACLALKLTTSFSECCGYLAGFTGVEGRMQIVRKTPFTAIVDFAHTPNALEKALLSARKLTRGKLGRVIAVFGCAGNRDTLKRPIMGAAAKKYAEITILTVEDPRTEDIEKINLQIKEGWEKEHGMGKELFSIDLDGVENRQQAIKKAVEIAKPGDVVIICGKGHEKSMCFGNTEYPWNDVEEVKKALA